MSAVENSLDRLLKLPGVTGVALVDAVTGLTYGESGGESFDAGDCSRLAGLVGDRLHRAGADGELESIVITGARRQLVLRALPGHGDNLLLTVALERQQSNLALVLHHLGLYPERESA
ncbi:hypothetical protein ACIPPJ_25805 [Streptomyces sp. NPDC086091]|uniref:hypothetical protein n=1 Tax=unclassified Streptomyces TaxID=2593676 RepID=UPI003668B202